MEMSLISVEIVQNMIDKEEDKTTR